MAREHLAQMQTPAQWREFASRGELAAAFAADVAKALTHAIGQRGTAFLAVSGGTTPAGFFRALSNEDVDWKKVVITLIDERFVPETSPRSNAALVTSSLLQNRAKAARFVALYQPVETVEAAADQASKALAALPWPLDIAVLGMGADGHTASFFPDAVSLDTLLSPSENGFVLPVHSLSAGERRLTMPLSRIAAADWVVVHIEGADKRAVLEAALQPEVARPISSVFRQGRKRPVDIYWAP
jgi:6-phosphogluconolactonase